MTEPTNEPRAASRLESAALALAIAVPVTLTLHPIQMDDLFFHLAGGRWIWEHAKIPHTDPFSWSRAGLPWVNFEWLFQIAVYALESLAGLNGLVLGFAALTGLIFWLMARLCRRLGLTVAATAVLILMAAVLARERLLLFRPEFVTLCGGVVSLLILERACARPQTRALWFFPPLLWVWSNMHGGFPLGLALLAIYGAGAAAQRCLGPREIPTLAADRAQAMRVAWVAGASLLACVVNPYGTGLLRNVFWQLRPSTSRALIVEWQPLIGSTFAIDPILLWGFKIAVAGGVIGFLLNGRRIHWARLAVFALVTVLTWKGRRFLPLFGLLALPLAAAQWREVVARGKWRVFSRPPFRFGCGVLAQRRLRGGLVGAIGALALWLIVATVTQHGDFWGKRGVVGLGLDSLSCPVAAVEFLRQHSGGELKLFNDMNLAAYQMWAWPGQRTFVDVRNVFFGDAFMLDYVRALTSESAWRRLLVRYDFEAVLLNSHAQGNATLLHALLHDPQWKRVYLDEVACVFVRTPLAENWPVGGIRDLQSVAEVRQWRREAEARFFKTCLTAASLPGWWGEEIRAALRINLQMRLAEALYLAEAKSTARVELEDLLRAHPSEYDALRLLIAITLESRDYAAAQTYLDRMLELGLGSASLHLMISRLFHLQGKIPEAFAEAGRATELAPNSVTALEWEAEMASAAGALPRAEDCLRRVVKLYALPMPDPYLRLASVQEQRGKMDDAIQNYRRALALWGEPDAQYRAVQQHVESLASARKGPAR